MKEKSMCLAIPMEVLKIDGNSALVSAGGAKREVSLATVDEMPEVGDYVIVHAGFAFHRIDEETAKQSLEIWSEIFEAYEASE
jgi:hydrogenase expression/formation protein HypC